MVELKESKVASSINKLPYDRTSQLALLEAIEKVQQRIKEVDDLDVSFSSNIYLKFSLINLCKKSKLSVEISNLWYFWKISNVWKLNIYFKNHLLYLLISID